jgi:hypothetical protein
MAQGRLATSSAVECRVRPTTTNCYPMHFRLRLPRRANSGGSCKPEDFGGRKPSLSSVGSLPAGPTHWLRQTNEGSRTSAADTGFNSPYAGAVPVLASAWAQEQYKHAVCCFSRDGRGTRARRSWECCIVMRIGLFSALLIVVALTAGVALGFLAEQATQPSPSTQSSDSTQRLAEPVLTPGGTYGDRL